MDNREKLSEIKKLNGALDSGKLTAESHAKLSAALRLRPSIYYKTKIEVGFDTAFARRKLTAGGPAWQPDLDVAPQTGGWESELTNDFKKWEAAEIKKLDAALQRKKISAENHAVLTEALRLPRSAYCKKKVELGFDVVYAKKELKSIFRGNGTSGLRPAKKEKHKLSESVQETEKQISERSQPRMLVGLIGSVILFIGVFAPVLTIPTMGDLNYFRNGQGDGSIVLVLSVISFVLVLTDKYRGLWFTGVGSLFILMFTFVHFQLTMTQVSADLEYELAGNPFRGLADMAMESVQLQWGWALLIVGAGLVIASAAMKN